MALPTVVINSSTGSDTLASGAGPATALTGTLAATNSSTTVNITDAVALGGVAVDGSAVLWIASTSGRRWSKITAISGSSGAWVVTVSDAYANTESSKSWAIGGKRATLANSLQLGTDCRSGWTIDVQDNQTLTANFSLKPNVVSQQWTTFTSMAGTRPTISTATNSIYGLDIASANALVISHIHFKSTAGTPGNGIAPATVAGAVCVVVDDCLIEGFASGIQDHDNGGNVDVTGFWINGCEIKTCANGLVLWAGCEITNCYVHHNTTRGLYGTGTRSLVFNIKNSIFDSNGTAAASPAIGASCQTASGRSVVIKNCVFANTPNSGGATSPGLSLDATAGPTTVLIEDSIFWNNAKYGIAYSAANFDGVVIRNCAFGSNGTADVSAFTTGLNPVTLTANPFVSATDFGLNNTAGGGALCRGTSSAIPNASANSAGDIGAIPSGGGGSAAATGAVLARVRTGM